MIAVCDDEVRECLDFSRKIESLLKKMCVPCVVRQYNSGKALLKEAAAYEMIFLDIMMDEMDGMQTARMLRRNYPEKILVFVSSSRQYVFDAFGVEAFAYLVKPVKEDELRQTFSRCLARLERRSGDYRMISQGRQTANLFLDEILYFEIRGRIIEAHGKDGIVSWYEKINVLEEALRGRNFFRCHKSYLVNLKYVDVYNRQEVSLAGGEKISIARRRYEDFCQAVLNYMRDNGGVVES